jgi:hypothetical protein
MTDSSLRTRPSPLLAGVRSPFLVSSPFIDGHTGQSSELFVRLPCRFSTTVALALREQVLDAGEVPVGANDVSVDMIVTPDEIIAGTSK